MVYYYFYYISTHLYAFGKEMNRVSTESNTIGTYKDRRYVSALGYTLLVQACMVYLVLVP